MRRSSTAPRKKKEKKDARESEELKAVKKKLDAGIHIELGPDSIFDLPPEGNHEETDEDNQLDVEVLPEFDTTRSSILSELRAILEDINQSHDSPV